MPVSTRSFKILHDKARRRVHLDESISSSVVCDSETQCILCLCHLHLLGVPSDVSEDEVFQADLPPQQLLHVHFMRVEGAEQDLSARAG